MRRIVYTVSAAALMAAGASTAVAQDDWPTSMTVATASPGGVYAVYGQGIATIVSDAVGIPTSTQQTQGPGQNVVLVNNGQAQIGMTTMGPAWQGWNAELDLDPGTEFREFRALFPMYRTPFQMITLAETGITGLADLEGLTVGMAPRAGTGGTYWPIWLEQMGISVNAQFGPASDQGGQLGDGRLDAIIMAGGVPHPMMSEVEASHEVNIFGLTPEQIEMILEANPYVEPFDIPQEMYTSVSEDVPSVAMWNIAIAHQDMPDDLAYAIVEAIFDNHDRLVQTHASAVETLLEHVDKNDTIPYHPGAIAYFQDQGIEVPEVVE